MYQVIPLQMSLWTGLVPNMYKCGQLFCRKFLREHGKLNIYIFFKKIKQNSITVLVNSDFGSIIWTNFCKCVNPYKPKLTPEKYVLYTWTPWQNSLQRNKVQTTNIKYLEGNSTWQSIFVNTSFLVPASKNHHQTLSKIQLVHYLTLSLINF